MFNKFSQIRHIFKELSAEGQEICLHDLLIEHAYYRGLNNLNKNIEPPNQEHIDKCFEDGIRHYNENKKI